MESGIHRTSSKLSGEMLRDIETQPNVLDDFERQFWADDERDSSSSEDRLLSMQDFKKRVHRPRLVNANRFHLKRRKCLKRTPRSVVGKLRVCLKRIERRVKPSFPSLNSDEAFEPNWNFSNLPTAAKYTQDYQQSPSNSSTDIRMERKCDWITWRARKLTLSIPNNEDQREPTRLPHIRRAVVFYNLPIGLSRNKF
ncbi:uncharacterized protein LOC111046019 [Nilaparvata lugens]|uniref:uncharacterized protein LOC111046019 n=1 Tax=Nilaparvata lugens TaxID=108931 RepID=UPI00193EA0E0|nr:uncharacterized protein LOC111046019 [Nilaparvata lugens]